LQSQLTIQERILDTLKEQGKTIESNLSLFGKQGPLNEAELSERGKKIAESLSSFPVSIKLEVDTSIQKIKSQLDTAFAEYRQSVGGLDQLEQLTGKKVSTVLDVTTGKQDIQKEAAALRKAFGDSQAAAEKITLLRREIQQAQTDADSLGRSLSRSIGGQTTPLSEQRTMLADFRNALDRASKSAKITDQDIAELLKKLGKLDTLSQSGLFDNVGGAMDVSAFSQALEKVKQIQTLQKQQATSPASVPGANDRLQQLQQYLQTIQGSTGAASSSADNLLNSLTSAAQIDFSSLVSGLNSATAAMQQLASMSYTVPNITAASGGIMRYLADGGNVGTDTVPAMLSAGEFVVNAGATKKWYSQLVSMNAGGPVAVPRSVTNNNTIGDVVVNGSGSPQQTAREVMQAIKRELRRGSGTL
jgi:chromosome segregation ATPase